MAIKPEHLSEIVYDLQGTCQSVNEVLALHGYDEMDLDHEAALYIDERIFECEQCNWWFEIGEMDEDTEWVCEDCVKYG